MSYGYTYRTTCLESGRVYIGQRRRPHFDPKYLGSGKLIRFAVQKHGEEKFRVEVLDFAENKRELDRAEQRLIIEHRNLLGFARVYNITPGGEGCGKGPEHPSWGRKATAEERQRMSDQRSGDKNPMFGTHPAGPLNPRFGVKLTAETKAKIGAKNRTYRGANHGNFGKVRSAETRAKISAGKKGQASRLGAVLSEETKRKIGDANRRIRAEKKRRAEF